MPAANLLSLSLFPVSHAWSLSQPGMALKSQMWPYFPSQQMANKTLSKQDRRCFDKISAVRAHGRLSRPVDAVLVCAPHRVWLGKRRLQLANRPESVLYRAAGPVQLSFAAFGVALLEIEACNQSCGTKPNMKNEDIFGAVSVAMLLLLTAWEMRGPWSSLPRLDLLPASSSSGAVCSEAHC